MEFNIDVGPGELIDRYTILQVKLKNTKNIEAIEKINYQIEKMQKHFDAIADQIPEYVEDLLRLHQQGWNTQDQIRQGTLSNNDDLVLAMGKQEWQINDKRAAIKSKIDNFFQSKNTEVKNYKYK
jgi:hypothetical protein